MKCMLVKLHLCAVLIILCVNNKNFLTTLEHDVTLHHRQHRVFFIVQLPSNLFFGTSIATCIMVLKKGKADNKTLFIDASGECIKVTNNNKLTQANIERIVETFAKRAEEAHFSHLESYEEIADNDYNLSVSTYVEAEDTREKIDIVKLNAEIEKIVAREQVLRDEIAKIIAEIEVG